MEVRIQSLNFDATEKLESFIERKVQKLERFYDNIAQVEAVLEVVKPETSNNKKASIQVLPSTGGDFYASKICDTFEEAIDDSVVALERQLVRFKEKQRKA